MPTSKTPHSIPALPKNKITAQLPDTAPTLEPVFGVYAIKDAGFQTFASVDFGGKNFAAVDPQACNSNLFVAYHYDAIIAGTSPITTIAPKQAGLYRVDFYTTYEAKPNSPTLANRKARSTVMLLGKHSNEIGYADHESFPGQVGISQAIHVSRFTRLEANEEVRIVFAIEAVSGLQPWCGSLPNGRRLTGFHLTLVEPHKNSA